jgi:hypothetical protein
MYNTVEEIDMEIKLNSEKNVELQETRKKLITNRKSHSEAGKLAVILHDLNCHYDHTDGCSWWYEVKGAVADWGASAHGQYYAMAGRMLVNNSYEVIILVLKDMKPGHTIWKK